MPPEDSWVLKAIEREADRRAEARYLASPPAISVYGLNAGQIKWLKRWYEAEIGEHASKIDPKSPLPLTPYPGGEIA